MAEQLVENLAEPFDPSRYADDYREELLHGAEPGTSRRSAGAAKAAKAGVKAAAGGKAAAVRGPSKPERKVRKAS